MYSVSSIVKDEYHRSRISYKGISYNGEYLYNIFPCRLVEEVDLLHIFGYNEIYRDRKIITFLYTLDAFLLHFQYYNLENINIITMHRTKNCLIEIFTSRVSTEEKDWQCVIFYTVLYFRDKNALHQLSSHGSWGEAGLKDPKLSQYLSISRHPSPPAHQDQA